MKIGHLALWVRDLEVSKEFYGKYFLAKAGYNHHNPVFPYFFKWG